MSSSSISSSRPFTSELHQFNCTAATCETIPHAGIVQPQTWYQQIEEFFKGLFNTADFPARWHCGNWTDFHGMLYIASDVMIWLAYFAIPFLLYRLLTIRKDIPFHRIFLFFIGFIMLCGLTHLIDAFIFWWPIYRFSALLRFATAVVSLSTVYQLYRVFPDIARLRSISDLEQEIEKRRITEEQLAANEFLLSEAGRIAGVGGWEITMPNDERIWSRTVYDILELPLSHDIKKDTIRTYYPEPYATMLEQVMDVALRTGEKWDMEIQAKTLSGKNIWVRHTGEVVLDEHGSVVKLRGILMKIDQYKNHELELMTALTASKQKQQQLENFSYMLSHHIRNHTSNLSALTEMISTEALDKESKELFLKTRQVVADLKVTLNEVTDVIQARVFPVKQQSINLKMAISNSLQFLEEQIIANDVKIEQFLEVMEVSFSPGYLKSILSQLILNAIQYRSPEIPLVISINSYLEDGGVILEISDNGLGIDLEKYGSKVFDLYATFHNYPGARGVGLYLIKTQLESLEGKISVSSLVGKGSTFKISFPIPRKEV